MELTDPKLLEAILLMVSDARPTPKKLRQPAQAKRRCNCGACYTCVENARWERIFQEKFADPNYYARSPLRQDSSLNW
jgi:hypothetical protein